MSPSGIADSELMLLLSEEDGLLTAGREEETPEETEDDAEEEEGVSFLPAHPTIERASAAVKMISIVFFIGWFASFQGDKYSRRKRGDGASLVIDSVSIACGIIHPGEKIAEKEKTAKKKDPNRILPLSI